ncbi:creatinine amidohydrolase [Saccharopolyspora lacisalsi]|uniref:Creatinine amidohydrolase n=1 Tax=Halosaccharopolyspora lacisalsi TaxID=1000566 RepID=A0A839E0D4_9PSEU|nr:mycofactocin biosynthesis peptidyl-dipeptidase MftE [Halosaccharopolyspora lacisalsi]MBA8826379.1 creatinine amidohydrolase [Halosaccharopolyspora lacisalsi]
MSLLAERSWSDLVDRRPTVLLPLGACEQHGPHLPLDTDSVIAGEVAERAVSRLSGEIDALLAPAQPYAASGEHEGFPGTVSIGHRALTLLLVELGRSMSRWAHKLVVVNGHGGNHASVEAAVSGLRREGRDVAWWQCGVSGGDAHAGRTETSLMCALRRDSVRVEHAREGRTEPLRELMPELTAKGVVGVSSNGVLGDPVGSSAAEGAGALARMVEQLATAVAEWQVEDGFLRSASRGTNS